MRTLKFCNFLPNETSLQSRCFLISLPSDVPDLASILQSWLDSFKYPLETRLFESIYTNPKETRRCMNVTFHITLLKTPHIGFAYRKSGVHWKTPNFGIEAYFLEDHKEFQKLSVKSPENPNFQVCPGLRDSSNVLPFLNLPL